ncbi:hypothetical protein D3C73_1580750 [compost metagenome]
MSHQYPSIHDCGIHVGTCCAVCHEGVRIMHGLQVRLVKINQDEIRLLADRKRTNLMINSQ